MNNLLELQVYWEDANELKTLWLTPEEHERAMKDQQFVISLLQRPKKLFTEKNVSFSVSEKDISLALNEHDISPSVQEKEDISKYIWTDAGALLLLDLYKNREDEFSSGKKRHNQIWTEIAEEMKLHNYNVTGTQCTVKLAGLKRTYKQIKDNNKKSGNGRSTWVLYSAVDSVFGKKTWAEPKYLASSNDFVSLDNKENEDIPSSPPNQPKKRKVEKIIESYMQEIKDEKVAEQAEKAKKEEARDKLKTEKYNERKEERRSMHEEKMNLMRDMIHVLKDLSRP